MIFFLTLCTRVSFIRNVLPALLASSTGNSHFPPQLGYFIAWVELSALLSDKTKMLGHSHIRYYWKPAHYWFYLYTKTSFIRYSFNLKGTRRKKFNFCDENKVLLVLVFSKIIFLGNLNFNVYTYRDTTIA